MPTKTVEQQSCLMLHRARHLFIRQQTAVLDTGARRLADRLVSCTGLDLLPADHAPGVLEKTLLASSVEGTIESSSVSPQPGDLKNNEIGRKYSQGEKP
jgi:hypothetical protein